MSTREKVQKLNKLSQHLSKTLGTKFLKTTDVRKVESTESNHQDCSYSEAAHPRDVHTKGLAGHTLHRDTQRLSSNYTHIIHSGLASRMEE